MKLVDRLRTPPKETRSTTYTLGQYLEMVNFQGVQYLLNQQASNLASPGEKVDAGASYVQSVYHRNGVVGAAVTARALLMSQLRFRWRSSITEQQGATFGTPELSVLEQPGNGMSRAELLFTAEQHVSLAGNAFFYRNAGTLRLLRPDWVTVLYGSELDGADPTCQADMTLLGYIYTPGGDTNGTPIRLVPEQVAHWKPEPDPIAWWRGESWVTSVLREIGTDGQATDFKSKFFTNSATPQLIVTLDPAVTATQAKEYAAIFNEEHAGAANAFKTLFMGGGASVNVAGSNLTELSLKDTQGGDESRIASRSRVPAVVLGIREGMQGSALNAGNYSQTRRLWADGWFTPTAQGLCSVLERVLTVPANSELDYDPARIQFLQEDRKDEADIMQANANAMRQLVDGGFDPASVVDAIATGDVTKLSHTGNLSVQLQPPGTTPDALPPG